MVGTNFAKYFVWHYAIVSLVARDQVIERILVSPHDLAPEHISLEDPWPYHTVKSSYNTGTNRAEVKVQLARWLE